MRREQFIKKSTISAPADDVFRWHEQPGAFERLTPPWEHVEVLHRSGGIRDGDTVEILTGRKPFAMRWQIEHADYECGRQFRDRQISGPFACWDHLHRIEPDGPDRCVLQDRITYALPLGELGGAIAGATVRRKLDRLFRYRHRVTSDDLYQIQQLGVKPMNIAVTGATGLVGRSVMPLLSTAGHQVTALKRSDQATGAGAYWNPQARISDPSWLAGCDAVVHLAGENIAGRWTVSKKARIRDSRVRGTRMLCESIAKMPSPPKVLVCASAIGFYGDRGEEELTEQSSGGTGFLADVCRDWEDAVAPARDAGVRVVHLRYGVVLSAAGGALAKMLTPFKLGVGGLIGDGRQYMSWIAIDDAAGLIAHALSTQSLNGPVNAVAPQPVTNRTFTKTLGRVLRRPTVFPMPAFAARAVFGEMADALLLSSTRVIPKRALESGYAFRFPQLEDALRHVLGR